MKSSSIGYIFVCIHFLSFLGTFFIQEWFHDRKEQEQQNFWTSEHCWRPFYVVLYGILCPFWQIIGLLHSFMVPFLAVINPNSFGLVHLWKIRYVDYVENILIFLVWNVFVFQRPFQDQWECWNFVKILFSLQSPILQLLSSNFFSSI